MKEVTQAIKIILDKMPCFEDNVKRYNDILTLVEGWSIRSDTKWTCDACGAKFDEPKWLEQPDDVENPICPKCESLNIDLTESIISKGERTP